MRDRGECASIHTARFDHSTRSGVSGFTDIMSIPPSVARRAYQAAEAGQVSTFFYVRRFVDLSGGPDLEVDDERGDRLLEAIIAPPSTGYRAPPWITDGTRQLRWRVVALDRTGAAVRRTEWRTVAVTEP